MAASVAVGEKPVLLGVGFLLPPSGCPFCLRLLTGQRQGVYFYFYLGFPWIFFFYFILYFFVVGVH